MHNKDVDESSSSEVFNDKSTSMSLVHSEIDGSCSVTSFSFSDDEEENHTNGSETPLYEGNIHLPPTYEGAVGYTDC